MLDFVADGGDGRRELGLCCRLPLALGRQAALAVGQLGANLTVLTDDQADYIGVSKDGPYKPATYRY